MGAINDAWRDILYYNNQNTLVEILKNNLIDILKQAERLAFIKELEEDEIEKIKILMNCLLKSKRHIAASTDKTVKVCVSFGKNSSLMLRAENLTRVQTKKTLMMILNRIDVFSNAVETLVYFRNTAYHRNDPIDDPGHATALAGTVLHMIEHSVSSGNDKAEARIDALRKKALSVLKLCSSFYGEDEEQATSSPTPLESPSTHTEEEKEEANIVVEKLEEFRSEWEDAVKTLLHRIPDESQMRLLASNAATQSAKKTLEALNKEEFSEFCAAAVAAGLETSLVQVERRCAQLARRGQFVCSIGQEEWPDGTLSERYVFRHALYQQVWSERVPTGWRMQLHRQIGERKERGYGPQASDRAAELAVHFEDGRDGERALVYLKHAADKAVKQSAHHEAIRHLTKGLELIQTLPSTPEQARQELDVRITLGVALIAVKGYAAVEVAQAFTRALELCRHIGETPQIVPALSGLLGVALMQAKVAEAHALSVQCLRIAQRVQEPKLLCEAHATLGVTSFIQGAFGDARNHLKQGMRYYDPLHYRDQAVLHDPRINYESYQAWTLWSLGYPDQAITKMQDTLELAQRLSQPHGVAYASHFAALLYLLQGEKQLVQDLADRLVALADEHTFPMWLAWGTFYHGWVLAEQEQWEDGIACMRRSQAANQTMRAESGHPYRQGVLARAYAQSGKWKRALRSCMRR